MDSVYHTMLASPEYQAGRSAIIISWDDASAKTTKMPYIVTLSGTGRLQRSQWPRPRFRAQLPEHLNPGVAWLSTPPSPIRSPCAAPA